ncbi:MAG: hypothetical protein KGL92_07100, partial [Gammaproteobacteria bacterium]|nr:hypothetical protein [Gammaproteobacteria bacterium]
MSQPRPHPPRFLFVPVSGAFGMGEYARSLAIARAARGRWPDASIRFMLSREAPYAAATPFDATLLPSSPTFHSAEVAAAIAAMRPDVVIFDNAGRTAQLRAAVAAGAAVVYISARARQWRKAHRLRWMRLIDEHWAAYPRFLSAAPGRFDALKLRWLGRPVIRHLDVVLPAPDPARRAALLADLSGGAAPILVVPGGGTGHPGAADAAAIFLDVAGALAADGDAVIYVGPAWRAQAPAPATPLSGRAALPQADLVELMRAARLVVVNGGSTLAQAIACGAACVAAPIAKDQAARIGRAVAAGVARGSPLRADAIVREARHLLR